MISSLIYSLCFVLTVYLHKFFKKVVFKSRKFVKSENLKYRILAISLITLIFFIHSLISFLSSSEKLGFMDFYNMKTDFSSIVYTLLVNSLLFLGPIYQEFHYNRLNIWTFLIFSRLLDDWDYLRLVIFVIDYLNYRYYKLFKAPLFEEFVFRDLIYTDLLKSSYSENQYVWISSLLFSLGFTLKTY